MKEKEHEAFLLIEECETNISNGRVNNYGSYDEGVRDALLWYLDDTPKPYIGRE